VDEQKIREIFLAVKTPPNTRLKGNSSDLISQLWSHQSPGGAGRGTPAVVGQPRYSPGYGSRVIPEYNPYLDIDPCKAWRLAKEKTPAFLKAGVGVPGVKHHLEGELHVGEFTRTAAQSKWTAVGQ
jgi:hypothetical protein